MLSRNAQNVQDALLEKGLTFKVVELAASTRTAEDAANTIGCKVEQIVKSLIFCTAQTLKPILILVSGSNRVNEKSIESIIGEKIKKADAAFTKEVTGFAIGGVAPIGHKQPIETYIDKDLMKYDTVWAAAGMPNAVFSLRSSDLEQLTHGKIITVT
jgi:Cys-tRNA(Pro) deacylase